MDHWRPTLNIVRGLTQACNEWVVLPQDEQCSSLLNMDLGSLMTYWNNDLLGGKIYWYMRIMKIAIYIELFLCRETPYVANFSALHT